MTPEELSAATSDHLCIPQDSVDRLLEHWHAVRPALDFSPVGVISRLDRVRGHIDLELDRLFAEYGLTAPGFAVLVTLARLNDPEGVSQRRLMDELGLTSGTVSVRMDRLQEAGLIERAADEQDRRNTRVKLTEEGRALFERIVPAHLENENRLLAALSGQERELLAALLGKLLVEFEGTLPPADAPFSLGMTVAPAHVTIAMRRAVGLDPEPGLLVRRVEQHGPAAKAGVAPGDVILASGKRAIRSVAALYAAIAAAAPSGRLRLQLRRGSEKHTVTIPLEGLPADADGPMGARTRGRVGHDEHTL